MNDYSIKFCSKIFSNLPEVELNEFIQSLGISNHGSKVKKQKILEKFYGNAFLSCLKKCYELGEDKVKLDEENAESWKYLSEKYIKWKSKIIKKGLKNKTPKEVQAYSIYIFLDRLHKKGREAGDLINKDAGKFNKEHNKSHFRHIVDNVGFMIYPAIGSLVFIILYVAYRNFWFNFRLLFKKE